MKIKKKIINKFYYVFQPKKTENCKNKSRILNKMKMKRKKKEKYNHSIKYLKLNIIVDEYLTID